jgi:hypothetical protein
LVVALAKFKEDHQTSQKYSPQLNGFILQWAIHHAVIKLQSLNTKMTPHLLPELLMALRANDADGLLSVLNSMRQVVIELIQD